MQAATLNYELRIKDSLCSGAVGVGLPLNCELHSNVKSFRIVVARQADRGSVGERVPLHMEIMGEGYNLRESGILPRSASVGFSWRYSGTLNYGVWSVGAVLPVKISIESEAETRKFDTFHAHLKGDPRNDVVYALGAASIAMFLMGARFRRKLFRNKITSFIPYTLIFLVSFVVLGWNV